MTNATAYARIVNDPVNIPDGQEVGQLQVVDADGNPVAFEPTSPITSVTAVKLAADAEPTATLADGVLTIGIPQGARGETGATGTPGAKGDAGTPGAAGAGVSSIALTVDTAGKVTGGTLTRTDKTTAPITVTTATA